MSKTHDASLADTLFPSSYTVISAAYSRNGDSVKLILSGDETLVLPAKEYALLNLKEESTLTREELVELKKSEALLMARKKALRLLDRRAYTGAQLKLKLSAAMYPKTVIRQVLQQLLEQGYLDDEKYAKEWLAIQIKRKPQGRHLLYAGLVRKGIDRRQAERLIDEVFSPEAECEQCEQLMRTLAAKRGWEAEILLPAMARRGFHSSLIKQVYRKLKK